MTSAEPADGDAVTVTAEVHGETERGEAWFRVDRTARRIQWGSEGDSDYSGTLNLRAEQDRTVVDIDLHTEHTATDEIDQSLDTTLDHIQHQVRNRPGNRHVTERESLWLADSGDAVSYPMMTGTERRRRGVSGALLPEVFAVRVPRAMPAYRPDVLPTR